MIALALAAMARALATAPNASYVQVQSTAATTGMSTMPGAAIDNAAAATGNAVDNTVDTNKSVDTNNDCVADTSRRDSVSGLGTGTADRR